MAQRNYRDPIHNIISLDEASVEDRLIIDLVDTAEFQRLRRIKQLGLALFTYQGAEHSRFTHSLGVMHLMTRALDQLGRHHPIASGARLAGRAAALLHDLGHGPLSHLIEKVFSLKHEEWTRHIISDESTEANRALRACDPDLPRMLASIYAHEYEPSFVSQLVSSQLDCDRMDYLLRDSLMTGVKYGVFDLEWILRAIRIDPATRGIYVESKGLHAVEEYLLARYYMFRQVYFHRTLRSAEAVLMAALTRARELAEAGGAGLSIHGEVFEKMLLGKPTSTAEYLELDDVNLLFHLKQWVYSPDPLLADLSARFVNRKLFKAIDLEVDSSRAAELLKQISEVVAGAGLDPRYYLVSDRASDIPYYGYYIPAGSDSKSHIYVEAQDQGLAEIGEISEIVRAMRAYRIDRICFPAEVTTPIQALIDSYYQDSRKATT